METRALVAAGQAAVPALRAALRSRDAATRRQAVAILARLSGPPEDVIDDLLARAQDKDKDVRFAAVRALDGFGPAAAKTHAALLELAKQDASLQRAAELAALNVSREPQKPRYRSVLETRPCAEAIAALKDPDPAIRQEAAEALRTRIEDPSAAANALIEVLSDKEPQVRAAAARSLALYGKYARVAMSTFLELLEGVAKQSRVFNDETPQEEKRAFYAEAKAALVALAGMGADAKPALPALTHLALSQHPGQDTDLGELLGTVLRLIGPDAVPSLTAGLKDPNESVRAAAARTLASMGAVAATGVPELIELCKSTVDSDAQAGFAALQAIGPPAYGMAAPYLVNVIHGDLFADRRKWAAWALGGIRVPESGDAAKVIDTLMLALLDTDDGVCRGAHAALARIGATALPRLRDMLKLGEGEAPYWAVRVLARMKADPADVIPPLAELTLPGRRPVERGTAAELLGEYAPAHPEIIPVLLRLMGDREDYVARIAGRALVPFGEKVVEPLRKLLQDRNPLVRRRALDALDIIHTALDARPGTQ
jgi:HEAT repeat protein